MPQIRVMNWNIQNCSWNKIQIPGMLDALARVIHSENVDIAIIVEVAKTNAAAVMAGLATALTARTAAAAGVAPAAVPAANRWYGFLSFETGNEHYGFLVRGLNLVRPLWYAHHHAVPFAEQTDGSKHQPFNDLNKLRWSTWPNNNWAGALPAPAAFPAAPRMGLIDLFATPRLSREAKDDKFGFAGQLSGYVAGRGFRMPCLAMFHVHTPAGTDCILPIVVCHYAAVRDEDARNVLAQQQVSQLKLLHVAQLFSAPPAAGGAPFAGFLDVDNAPRLLQELMFTGDFNLDFLQNDPAAAARSVARTNSNAYGNITPTQQNGGSAAPAAAPGGWPPGVAAPGPPVPFAAMSPRREVADVDRQRLRAALTGEGSMLKPYSDVAPLAAPVAADLVGAAFDNFFYGGTRLSGAAIPGGGIDAGRVVNVPGKIAPPAPLPGPGQVNVAPIQQFYRGLPIVVKSAGVADSNPLHGAGALTLKARLIGARFLSDHLPVILEFNCP